MTRAPLECSPKEEAMLLEELLLRSYWRQEERTAHAMERELLAREHEAEELDEVQAAAERLAAHYEALRMHWAA